MCKNFKHPIADANSVKKRVDQLTHRSSDIKSKLSFVLKKLWNPERHLNVVSSNIDFNHLRLNFPQFEEVIDFYQSTIIGLSKMEVPFEITPVLLQGEPGLGKTYFASELAKLIGLPFYEISLATATASFALSGGSIQWAEGSPGFICHTLAESEVANPIILIDEIDKASSESNFNPLKVFYGLLESHSAKRFRDEALEIELDASKIVWIATANYLHNIPEPIQSRMRIFQITQPEPLQMATVVKNIYTHLVESKPYGKLLNSSLDEPVIHNLATKSPRQIKLSLESAAFQAIRFERTAISVYDLPQVKKESYHVGFI